MKRFFVILSAGILAMTACQEHEPETGMVMSAPENIRCTGNTENSLAFSWDKVEGAEQYAARLVTTEDGESVELKYETSESVIFSGLESGVSYTCMVRAIAGMDYSPFASSEPVTTGGGLTPDPDVPEDEGLYAEMKIPVAEDEHGAALAFPGAEGGGMYTTGGRGGRIIHVTNLNDSGTGSLRAAVEASGPRIVVFDVAGIIELSSKLRIRNGDLTIAGQTAPGDGICIKNYATVVEADNVIIRFVRFRLGDQGADADDGEDAIWGRRQKDIIIDHCSMSWSIDECASFYGNSNFTMQWCILTESLRHSVHGKGSHGYGGIWGGENASFHHNLLANHDSRNPRFDHPEIYENPSDPDRRGNVDYRNNAVYNWGSNSTYGGEGGHFNMVGNYYRQGPASRDRAYFIDANGIYTSNGTDYGYPYLYMDGNHYVQYPDMTAGDGVYWHDHGTNIPPDASRLLSSLLPISGPDGQTVYTTTHSAQDAFALICETGGASLVRDEVDDRACLDAQSGTASYPDGGNGSEGGIVDTPSAVGGWPEYSADTENEANDKTDTDGDGIPDWFEEKFGLDTESDDSKAMTVDVKGRYTNIEMYLHYLVRDIVASQAGNGIYTALD
ncbi:MAG: fibronectin type III domain-containing protein [Bacteroidetes bacterium]|uniref:Fibronectin type III domain-containing protein n=1 Tax=Candidatus Cryptobacteroides gallistercoris TaxID=2840765 RepID=A0A940DL37_9BACT|nr:fibronectin type III domain-containing protein [Candidatus Cryptobacteroides gallistercoris]